MPRGVSEMWRPSLLPATRALTGLCRGCAAYTHPHGHAVHTRRQASPRVHTAETHPHAREAHAGETARAGAHAPGGLRGARGCLPACSRGLPLAGPPTGALAGRGCRCYTAVTFVLGGGPCRGRTPAWILGTDKCPDTLDAADVAQGEGSASGFAFGGGVGAGIRP